MSSSLAELGDPALLELYLRIARGRPRTIDGIREVAPSGADLARDLLRLERIGCIEVGRDGLVVHPPSEVIAATLSRRLRDARRTIDGLAAALAPTASATAPSSGPSPIAGAGAVPALPASGLGEVVGDVVAWWADVRRDPARSPCVAGLRIEQRLLAVEPAPDAPALRLILPIEAVADAPPGTVPALLERGVRLRAARRVPAWVYADGAGGAAFAPERGLDDVAGVVQSEHPPLVAAAGALLDAWWRAAVPIARAPSDVAVVDLLALGLDDRAVSRVTGLGLRSVRRRIAEAMSATGARSRFQLGAEWLRDRQRTENESDSVILD